MDVFEAYTLLEKEIRSDLKSNDQFIGNDYLEDDVYFVFCPFNNSIDYNPPQKKLWSVNKSTGEISVILEKKPELKSMKRKSMEC